MLAVALAVYLTPATARDNPTRVILDNNGGRVIFAHAVHASEYGYECTDCHHDDTDQKRPLACSACHPAAHDQEYRIGHQRSFSTETACLRCHDAAPHAPLVDSERPDAECIPLRADAFHGQCIECHAADGGPDGDDCSTCHAR